MSDMGQSSQNRQERFIKRHIVALTDIVGMSYAEAKVRVLGGDRNAMVAAQKAMGSVKLSKVPSGTPVVMHGAIFRVLRRGKYQAIQRLGKGGVPKETQVVPGHLYVIPMAYEDAVEWLFGKGPVEA